MERTVAFASTGNSIMEQTTRTSVKVYMLDSCANPGRKEDDWPGLRRLEERWYTDLGSLGLLDSVQGCNKKDDARAGAWKDN